MVLSYLKDLNQNVYSMVVSVLLVLWFNGISGILNYYYPTRGPLISVILLIIPAVLFYMGDGNLDKLYKQHNIEYPILSSVGQNGQNTNSGRRR